MAGSTNDLRRFYAEFGTRGGADLPGRMSARRPQPATTPAPAGCPSFLPPPPLGEHSDEVRREVELSEGRIAELRQREIV